MYCSIFICVYSSLARVETSEQQILARENRYGPKATLTIEGSEREARSYINAFSDLQTNVWVLLDRNRKYTVQVGPIKYRFSFSPIR